MTELYPQYEKKHVAIFTLTEISPAVAPQIEMSSPSCISHIRADAATDKSASTQLSHSTHSSKAKHFPRQFILTKYNDMYNSGDGA